MSYRNIEAILASGHENLEKVLGSKSLEQLANHKYKLV